MAKQLTLAEVTSMGGKARAKKLSKERRLEISRAANEAKRLKRAGVREYKKRAQTVQHEKSEARNQHCSK
jgi:hypothetical protein